jgi:hypothetical protein
VAVTSYEYQRELGVLESRRSERESKQTTVLAVGRKNRKNCSNNGYSM